MKLTSQNARDGALVVYYTEPTTYTAEITPAALKAVGTWMDPERTTAWHGNLNLWQSLDLAINGDVVDPQAIALRDRIATTLNVTKSQEQYMDVTGGSTFDIGAYVEGIPECVYAYQEAEGKARKCVNVFVEMGQACSISVESFRARGSAVMALIDALEMTGRFSVAVFCVISSGHRHKSGSVYQAVIRLKEHGHQYDPSTISYWLCNPGVFRQVGFAHLDLCPRRTETGIWRGQHGSEHRINLDGLQTAIDERDEAIDLCDKQYGNWSHFVNFETSLSWVEGQLEKYNARVA
jgi:hypothetical protein